VSTEPINTIPFQQFIQQVKSAENSRAREVKLSIEQAKNLAFTIGIVESRLHGDLEKLVKDSANANTEVIEVNLDAGSGF
jgi:hypothetical protein